MSERRRDNLLDPIVARKLFTVHGCIDCANLAQYSQALERNMTDVREAFAAPSIEPQYVLAAAQMAANLNTLIWQKATVIFAVQSATIAAAYAARGTLLSYLMVAVGLAVSLEITMTIGKDIKRRTRLLEQANHIARTFMSVLPPKPNSGRNDRLEFFDLYPFPVAGWARHGVGTLLRIAVIAGVNVLAAAILNFSVFQETAQRLLALPLLPPVRY